MPPPANALPVRLIDGITLTFVDPDIWAEVNLYNWRLNNMGYVYTWIHGNSFFLHRLIMNAPQGRELDHCDGDPLNNCRENLRYATRSQNMANMSKQRTPRSSRFKGVCWNPRSRKWRAYIVVNRRQRHLGTFSDQEEAARAYDAAAIQAWGPFSRLNFPAPVINIENLNININLAAAVPQ